MDVKSNLTPYVLKNICSLNTHLSNLISNDAAIPLLNGATGSIGNLKLPYNVYLVFGYVNTTNSTWFANFPAVPSTMYPQSGDAGAKLIAVAADGTVVPVGINRQCGMTVPKTGGYWIMGIVMGES